MKKDETHCNIWLWYDDVKGELRMKGAQELNEREMVNKMLSESLDGKMYLSYKQGHPQDAARLAEDVLGMVARHEMSVSAAKGFFDYMKTVVERRSRITGPA